MQSPAAFHDAIADARLAEAARGVAEATALDAAVDVRGAHMTAGDATIGGVLRA